MAGTLLKRFLALLIAATYFGAAIAAAASPVAECPGLEPAHRTPGMLTTAMELTHSGSNPASA